MRLALVASFALLALLMMTLEVGFASAHSLGHDAADGSEIRWEEYTRYEAEYRFGINGWDALGSVPLLRSESDANVESRRLPGLRRGRAGPLDAGGWRRRGCSEPL